MKRSKIDQKKALCAVLSTAVLMNSVGTVAFAESTKGYKDGVYEGQARGYKSDIAVSVTVSDGVISAIDVTGQNETPEFWERASAIIPKIIEANTTEGVDAVSGATRSSNGIKNAVNDALLKSIYGCFKSGSGSISDPFVISTAEQLIGFAESVDNGENYLGKYIVLDSDIDLSTAGNWDPIGAEGSAGKNLDKIFAGSFDGCGHIISGLTIHNDADSPYTEEQNVGLFSSISISAKVSNIRLENVDIDVTGQKVVRAGGITGDITSKAVSGQEGSASVDSCTVSGSVSAKTDAAMVMTGGVVGRASGNANITNCVSDAEINSSSNSKIAYGAGIAAMTGNNTYVVNCAGKGDVTVLTKSGFSLYAGGLAGMTNRSIQINCYTLGDICADAESNNKTTVGGLTGMSGGTNINCYTYGNVGSLVTTVDVGGINGRIAGIAVDHDCFYNSDAAQTIAGREVAEKRSSGTVVGEEINTYPVTAEKMASDKFLKHLNNNKENMTLILKDVSTYLEDMTENNKEGLSHFLFYTGDGSDLNSWTMGTKAPEFKNAAGIRVTYTRGDGCVKLDWSASENAEKYAVCGFVSGKWRILAEGYGTSYVLDDLSSGNYYKVAVIAKTNGVWSKDISNAVYVTPKAVEAHGYPEVSSVVYDENTHQFRLNWSAFDNAEMYGIAVKSAGKWKVQAYTDGDTTEFTSPKLRAGNKYEVVICAKVGGKWDISDIAGRSFTVAVK